MKMRICSKCEVEKPLEDFYRRKHGKYGRRARCKECMSEYGRAYRAGVRVTYELLPEGYRRCTQCQEVKLLETGFRRDVKGKDGRTAQCKECRADHQRAWYQANREAHIDRIEARERNMEPADAETIAYMKLLRKDPCSYCGRWPTEGEKSQIDHIVPVSQGGRNNWVNMTAACPRCNDSKNNKPLLLWLAERAGCRNEDGTKYTAPRSSGPIDEPDQMAAD